MYKRISAVCVVCVGLLALPASGQPREWSDDFMTVATYDDVSLLGPCYGGSVSTKYTVLEVFSGDIYNERALSGDGKLVVTNRSTANVVGGRFELVGIGVANLGQGCADLAGIPQGQTSEPFSSDNLCIYGGHMLSPWHVRLPDVLGDYEIVGPDGKPGVVNVDDDLDGTTDEDDESPSARPTTVNNGYGNRDGTGFQAGLDGEPGIAGADDDGNGITDDYGETGDPSSDDSDDRNAGNMLVMMDGNTATSSMVYVDLGPHGCCPFSMDAIKNLAWVGLDLSDEIGPKFYDPDVHYNWAFCTSGTSYGAMLWTESDIANPDELLGPELQTIYNVPEATIVGLVTTTPASTTITPFLRGRTFLGSSNLGNKFWVISGNPMAYPYFPSLNEDLDGDRDVDGNDFLTFSLCYNGSLRPPQSGCANLDADLDGDGDVDGFDFTTWSLCHNGSLKRPQAACMPPDLTGLEPGTSYGLVAHYHMDDPGSGTVVADSSGNGLHGSLQGTAVGYVPGTFGEALSFTGSAATPGFVEINADLAPILGRTATMTAWVKTTQTGSDRPWDSPGIAGNEDTSGGNDIFWGWMDNNGKMCIQAGDTDGAKSSSAINDGTWHHVAMTRHFATGKVKVYINGVPGSPASSGTGLKLRSFADIGRVLNVDGAGNHRYFNGEIDELRIYDYVLSDTEIADVYAYDPGP